MASKTSEQQKTQTHLIGEAIKGRKMNTFGNKMRKKDLKTFECEVCHKEFKQKSDLSQHQLTHQKENCQVCNREIRSDRMENHLKTHENEKERKFQCEICSLKFTTAISLRKHRYRHKQKEKALEPVLLQKFRPETKFRTSYEVSCEIPEV
jgi:stress-induced morphogen